MAIGLTFSVSLEGVTGSLVTIEADVSDGVPGWSLSGLPDRSVAEARDRCRAAMINSGQKWPDRKITVAMYPANVRKIGSHYDLAIALALLVANRVVPGDPLAGSAVLGELGLDGALRAVAGVLPATLTAADAGITRVFVPDANVGEAKLVDGIEVVGVRSLRECVAILCGEDPPDEPPVPPLQQTSTVYSTVASERLDGLDLADVRGQRQARRCIEVAAAGGHHVYFEGPPGAGKTMLAERVPGLLPDLSLAESLEVSKIHSVAGLLAAHRPLVTRPPFLSPHHTDTVPSIVGGGTKLIRPGAISLSHRGVLFLDEAPEFRPQVHDALRQPLESGEISISRAEGCARFPARFQLIMAANPCPCGKAWGRGVGCQCPPSVRRRYLERISGPIRDRMDILHTVMPVSRADLRQEFGLAESSAAVAARIAAARDRQARRFAASPWTRNCDVPGAALRRTWPLPAEEVARLEGHVDRGQLSARGMDRVGRLAWSVADLVGHDRPDFDDVAEALCLNTDGLLGLRESKQARA